MKNYCKNEGIVIEYTAAYTSEQDGVAERFNRTIMSMVRSMLFQAGLEKCYWGEALVTAVYTKNRVANKALDWKSPFEIWTGRKPVINCVRTKPWDMVL